MKIEHFAIYAEDTLSLANWYCDKFGMKIVFQGTQSQPMMFVADDHGMAIEIIGRPPRDKPYDFHAVFHFAFVVDDFDAALADLDRKGIPHEGEAVGAAEDVRICYFADPEGNRGQIVWRAQPLGS